MKKSIKAIALLGASTLFSTSAVADLCNDVSRADFRAAVEQAYTETNQFGFGLPMWATLMNQVGTVCHVYSVKGGNSPQANGGYNASQHAWLGSRVISAQKANTANAFSLNNLAISTGAITAATYEGGSLYGLQASNPVDATKAYAGNHNRFGTSRDPLRGKKIGGINYFGGGFAAYDDNGYKVGGIGVSGDTSCRDMAMSYRLRIALGLNNQPNDDGVVLVDTNFDDLTGLFQQPACGVNDPTSNSYDNSANDYGIR